MKTQLLLLFILLSFFAEANTYYISNTGNDRLDGKTQQTAWQTLRRVQIAAKDGSIKAGDKFLFQRGGFFTGNLTWSTLYGHHAPTGTAENPILFGAYGDGNKPQFQYHSDFETNPEKKVLFSIVGVDYIIFDGIEITDKIFPKDDKVSSANCAIGINFGIYGEAKSNHSIVRNCDFSNIGMGLVIIGDSNLVENCRITDLKNVRNSYGNEFPQNDDDYGANGVTITGNENTIQHNFFEGNWAESQDYGFSGGAIESFGSSSRNKILFNTIIDCNGVMEIGSGSGGIADDNLLANNLLINNGGLTWVNISGTFAIQASNIQYFNNTIIDTKNRFNDKALMSFNGKPIAKTVFNFQNNIFYLGSSIKITSDKIDQSKFNNHNNLYYVIDKQQINLPLAANEIISTKPIFIDNSSKDILTWNLELVPAFKNKKVGAKVPYTSNSSLLQHSSGVVPVTPNIAKSIIYAFQEFILKNDYKQLRWLLQFFSMITGISFFV